MFHVTNWDTLEIMLKATGEPMSFEKLAVARRWAKGCGHIGDEDNGLERYSPVAFVADDEGYCVYNPVFKKNLGPAVGNIINSVPST